MITDTEVQELVDRLPARTEVLRQRICGNTAQLCDLREYAMAITETLAGAIDIPSEVFAAYAATRLWLDAPCASNWYGAASLCRKLKHERYAKAAQAVALAACCLPMTKTPNFTKEAYRLYKHVMEIERCIYDHNQRCEREAQKIVDRLPSRYDKLKAKLAADEATVDEMCEYGMLLSEQVLLLVDDDPALVELHQALHYGLNDSYLAGAFSEDYRAITYRQQPNVPLTDASRALLCAIECSLRCHFHADVAATKCGLIRVEHFTSEALRVGAANSELAAYD